jgi:pimeloyl-ACP methyl ester carboxylesterase
VENVYRFHRRLQHSSILIYEDCGHLPMEELPRQSAADVREFLMNE